MVADAPGPALLAPSGLPRRLSFLHPVVHGRLYGCQVVVCQQRQRDVPAPPSPTPHLIMIQHDFAFLRLEELLHSPSRARHLSELSQRRAHWPRGDVLADFSRVHDA